MALPGKVCLWLPSLLFFTWACCLESVLILSPSLSCVYPEEKQTHFFWESRAVHTSEQQGQLRKCSVALLLILQEWARGPPCLKKKRKTKQNKPPAKQNTFCVQLWFCWKKSKLKKAANRLIACTGCYNNYWGSFSIPGCFCLTPVGGLFFCFCASAPKCFYLKTRGNSIS